MAERDLPPTNADLDAATDAAADVAVIGFGPAGMVLTALLARAGYRVVALERYPGLYGLPRAAIFDDETMRTFASLGITGELLPKVHAQRNYIWRNGDGEVLIEHEFAATGRSGWAEWYMMYQPDLEDALYRACRQEAGTDVRFGAVVTGIEQAPAGVTLHIDSPHGAGAPHGTGAPPGRDPQVVRARYAVGCDGGNSFTRQALAIGQHDYGFSEPWLVCDFRLTRPVDLPAAMQVCDPRQPQSVISLGPGHHRFSFMLDSAADVAVRRAPEQIWQRVAGYLTPADAELIRVATYTFRSLVADRWRAGRVLLAGDAAHEMPPFLGQGMCSGIRDAQNLAFKLDLILTGRAGDELLDTYQGEREPHVRAVIEKGIELGRIQTMRDPAAAKARDRDLLARRAARQAAEKIRFPGLTDGMLSGGLVPGRGELFIQAIVSDGRRTGRFDEVAGTGFVLLATGPEYRRLAAAGLDGALRAAGVRVAGLVPPGTGAAAPRPADGWLADVHGAYHRWLAERGSSAVAVRPDFYVYGCAAGQGGAERLAAELLADIGVTIANRAQSLLPETGP
ncbi:MAG TPA: bifunctional 3-(3-hydroxy-phenyl)propionate/3-hydroxycinnamic acid hydroxylase [Streptosporangiaceae bacterium]|nr:bifunctional 3-(3-hydroxy-phenyl)propionate/3-hydroxycinnamic acid hydroxylase [Streptosporangiaceae bacterium]